MKVTLATHGGLAAGMRRPPLVVDAAGLPTAAAEELARLVSAAKAAPQAADDSGGRARDAMTYELSVEEDGKRAVLTQSDSTMTKPFGALLAWLQRHAAAK